MSAQVQDSQGFPIPGCFRYVDGGGQSAAYTTTTPITNPVAATTRLVRVTCTTAAFIKFGSAPAATSADIFIGANLPEIFPITPGHKVAALQVAAGGTLYVQEIID